MSITITGNIATDPQVRFSSTGRAVAHFTVIENHRIRTDNGWIDGEPSFFRIQAWGPLAENIADSLTKGTRVIVTGTIRTQRWTDKTTGEERTNQHIEAEDVGTSLAFHTITGITKANRGRAAEPPSEAQPDPEPAPTEEVTTTTTSSRRKRS